MFPAVPPIKPSPLPSEKKLFDDLMVDETMNKDDRAVLNIINEILKNYHKLNIYNKKQLYMYVREATDLPSRKITKSIKKIKTSYVVLKDDFIN